MYKTQALTKSDKKKCEKAGKEEEEKWALGKTSSGGHLSRIPDLHPQPALDPPARPHAALESPSALPIRHRAS